MEQETAEADQTQQKAKLLDYVCGFMCIWHIRLPESTVFHCSCFFWLLVCKFPVVLSLLSNLLLWRSYPSGSVRLLMPVPPVTGIALVGVPGSSACLLWSRLGFLSAQPSRVFQAQCKTKRGQRTSHCFKDKSLGLILVPKKVTYPVCLCAKGQSQYLFWCLMHLNSSKLLGKSG